MRLSGTDGLNYNTGGSEAPGAEKPKTPPMAARCSTSTGATASGSMPFNLSGNASIHSMNTHVNTGISISKRINKNKIKERL